MSIDKRLRDQIRASYATKPTLMQRLMRWLRSLPQ